jgi:hypothetical protein
MCNNEGAGGKRGRFAREYRRKTSVIYRKPHKRNIPPTEEFLFPYDPKVPREDDCLMQED